MPKSEREGYSEAPFFFIDETEAPHAVVWLPMKLKSVVSKLLHHWPSRLQMHVEVLEDDFETVEFEAFGAITRDKLVKALSRHAEAAFADGGVRFRVWRLEADREHCLGVDEHGVLYIWEDPDRIREWLKGVGVNERTAPLVYEGDHDHHIPEDADLKRNRLLRALELEEV
jgi:hypothetical protein